MDKNAVIMALADYTIDAHWDLANPVHGVTGLRLRKANTTGMSVRTYTDTATSGDIMCLNMYGQEFPVDGDIANIMWDLYVVSSDQYGPIDIDIPHTKLTRLTTIASMRGALIVTQEGRALPLRDMYCVLTGGQSDSHADELLIVVPTTESLEYNPTAGSMYLKLIADSPTFVTEHLALNEFNDTYGDDVNAGNMPFTIVDGYVRWGDSMLGFTGNREFAVVTGSGVLNSQRTVSTCGVFTYSGSEYYLYAIPKAHNPTNLIIKPELLDLYLTVNDIGINITERLRGYVQSVTHSAIAIDKGRFDALMLELGATNTNVIQVVATRSGLATLVNEAHNLIGLYQNDDATIETTLLETREDSATPFWTAESLMTSTYLRLVTRILPTKTDMDSFDLFLSMYAYEDIIGIVSTRTFKFIRPANTVIKPLLYRDVEVHYLLHKDGLFIDPSEYDVVDTGNQVTFGFNKLDNGGFDDSTGWTLGGTATIHDGYATLRALFDYVAHDIAAIIGNTYRVKYEILANIGHGALYLSGSGFSGSLHIPSTVGEHSVTVVCTSNNVFKMVCITDGVTLDIDNIHVTQVDEEGDEITVEILPKADNTSRTVVIPPYSEYRDLFPQRRIRRTTEDYVLLSKGAAEEDPWIDLTGTLHDYVEHRVINGLQWIYFKRDYDTTMFVVSFGTGGIHQEIATTASPPTDAIILAEPVTGYYPDGIHIKHISHELFNIHNIGTVIAGPYTGTIAGVDLAVDPATADPANLVLSNTAHPAAMDECGVDLADGDALRIDLNTLILDNAYEPVLLELSYADDRNMPPEAVQTFSQLANDLLAVESALPGADDRPNDTLTDIDARYGSYMMTSIMVNETIHDIDWSKAPGNTYAIGIGPTDFDMGGLFIRNGEAGTTKRLAKLSIFLKNTLSSYETYFDNAPMFAMQNTIVILDGLRLVEGVDYRIQMAVVAGKQQATILFLLGSDPLLEDGHVIHVYAYRDVKVSDNVKTVVSSVVGVDETGSTMFDQISRPSVLFDTLPTDGRRVMIPDVSTYPVLASSTITSTWTPPEGVYGPWPEYIDAPLAFRVAASNHIATAKLNMSANMVIELELFSDEQVPTYVPLESIDLSSIRSSSNNAYFTTVTIKAYEAPAGGGSFLNLASAVTTGIRVISGIGPEGLANLSIHEFFIPNPDGTESPEVAVLPSICRITVEIHLDHIIDAYQPMIEIGSIRLNKDTNLLQLNSFYVTHVDSVWSVVYVIAGSRISHITNRTLVDSIVTRYDNLFNYVPGHIINIVDGLLKEEDYDPDLEGLTTYVQHRRVGFSLDAFNLIEEMLYRGGDTSSLLVD